MLQQNQPSYSNGGQGDSQVWITPKYIIDAVGPFDTDPCSNDVMPWKTAERMIALPQDGLKEEWSGMVWLNPPYGRGASKWLKKLSEHADRGGCGFALISVGTERAYWMKYVWQKALTMFFFHERIHFCFPDGTVSAGDTGGGSVLVAYGLTAKERLIKAAVDGKIKGILIDHWTVFNS